MDSRKVVAVYLAVLVVFSGMAYAGGPAVAAAAAANQSDLVISDQSVSDDSIVAGESTTVTADATNVGVFVDSFKIKLEIDGETDKYTWVTLNSGETTTVSFDRTFSQPGTYDIGVNGEPAGTLSVLAPAEMSVSSIGVSPNPVVESESVDIQATVENTGDVEGELTPELKVDGSVVATKTVTVPAGGTADVTFERTFDSPGEYEIQVSNSETATLTVKQAAEFEVSETELSESEIREGGSVTVSGTVTNVGGSAGEYTAPLTVDGRSVDSETIQLEAGQSQRVSFDRTFDDSGEYSIGIGDATAGTLTVLAPADLSVIDTTVSSDTVTTEESVQVDVTVENAGDITGEMTVSLGVDGETVTSKQVEVQGGQSNTVEFTERFNETGEKALSVNGDSAGTVSVLAPAEFVVSTASLNPTTMLEGNTTTATADIENVGDVSGSFTADLTVNGSTVASKQLTLDGGESKTVSFDRTFDSAGTYQIGVGGERAGELTVDAPASFTLKNTGVPERTILEGNRAVVLGTIENTGDRTGTFETVLRIDGERVDEQTIRLAGGETDRVEYRQRFSTAGTYSVSINGVSGGEITVEQPATFGEVSATVNTTRTIEGRAVAAELTVENTGDRTGTYRAVLTADGTRVGSQEVTVDGKETATVTVTERFVDAGSYELAFEETTAGTVVVEEPPELAVTNATIPADLVAAGERTTAEYTVENPGNWTVTQLINVTADGELIAQETVTVEPGERKEVVTEFEGTAGEIAVGGTAAGSVETIQDTESSEPETDGETGSSALPVIVLALVLLIVVGVAGVYVVDIDR